MTKIFMEQGSEAWYSIRCGRFTASQFSKLMAGKSTKSYQDLITNVAGQIISGLVETTYSNAIMERGIELEPIARREYESTFNIEVEQVGFILPDNNADWLGASPDGLTEGGLEIKCPLMKTHLNYMFAGQLPNEYKWQVQGSLFISGLPWWDFMSYYPNMKPFILRIYPDLEMFTALDSRLAEAIAEVKELIKTYNNYDLLGDMSLTTQLKDSISSI